MKTLSTALAAALVSTSAFAADAVFSSEPTPVVASVPAYVWTGAYVGLNAGYGGGKLKADASGDWLFGDGSSGVPTPFNLGASNTGSGFVGGAQAGYNWQSGSMVYGIETDIQYSGIDSKLTVYAGIPGEAFSAEVRGSIDWFGTTRARIGFLPTDRFMVYATGGVAYGKIKLGASTNSEGETVGISTSKTKVGWTAGAGAEYAINDKWSLKTEYLYTDLGKWTLWEGSTEAFENAKLDTRFGFHTARVGLNYRF